MLFSSSKEINRLKGLGLEDYFFTIIYILLYYVYYVHCVSFLRYLDFCVFHEPQTIKIMTSS